MNDVFLYKIPNTKKKNNFCKTKYDVEVRKSTGILYKDSDNSTREILSKVRILEYFFRFFLTKKSFCWRVF